MAGYFNVKTTYPLEKIEQTPQINPMNSQRENLIKHESVCC
jgi:hypothetical protein